MKKIIIVISFLCISLFTDAQLDITKRNITVTENFWKGGDSLYTAPEVEARIKESQEGNTLEQSVNNGIVFSTGANIKSSSFLTLDTASNNAKFMFSSDGANNFNTSPRIFALQNNNFVYRDNSTRSTDHLFNNFLITPNSYQWVYSDDGATVPFRGGMRVSKFAEEIVSFVIDETQDIGNQYAIDRYGIKFSFGGESDYFTVEPSQTFTGDSAYFTTQLIVNDTIQTKTGIKFPDGSFQSSAPAGGVVSPYAHSLLYTNTRGELLTSPNLKFEESGDGLQYTSTGEYSPTTQGVYFRMDDSFFRYRNNSLLNTDGKYCFVQFDDHKIKYNINNYAPYGLVDFIGDFTINGDLNRIDYHVSNEQSDKSIWHIIDSLSYTIQFDKAASYPYAVSPTYVFNRDTAYFGNKTIFEGGLKVKEGIEFPDGSIQTTATNVDCGNLHVEIYDIREYPSGKQHNTALGCGSGQLTLKARSNQDVVWEWGDNVMLSDRSADSADIMMGGTYSVRVTNTETGCTATSSVEITQDLEEPFVSIDTISLPGFIVLQGLSAIGSDYSYFWHKDGDALYQRGAMVIAKEAGRYELTVENNNNNCTNIHSVYLSEGMFGQ